MVDDNTGQVSERNELDRKINAISGGLLLIWIGFALLLDIGWGAGLIVVGILIIGEQVVRRYFSVQYENFWVVVGVISILSGVLILFGVEVSLIPILLIAFGIALLLSIFSKKEKEL